ncbi:MAG: hypothetical protein WC222_07210 [Parachlamydiales bacterium]|jgi:hypothetical protein
MFFQSSDEEKLQTNDKKLKEIGIQLEKLSADIDELYNVHKSNPDSIDTHFENAENFSQEEWDLLQQMLQHNNKKLEAIENKVVDPRETKKKYSERVVDPRWLFIR